MGKNRNLVAVLSGDAERVDVKTFADLLLAALNRTDLFALVRLQANESPKFTRRKLTTTGRLVVSALYLVSILKVGAAFVKLNPSSTEPFYAILICKFAQFRHPWFNAIRAFMVGSVSYSRRHRQTVTLCQRWGQTMQAYREVFYV